MSNKREPAATQLDDYARAHAGRACTATTSSGNPSKCLNSSQKAGPKGPLLLQDTQLIDELCHFNRERITDRVTHSKGTSAFGYFEVTHDITQYTAAKLFKTVGKKTPIAVRFSQSAYEKGSFDTYRDLRGFAVKFYTEDGIWDLVGGNIPVFYIREPMLFPSFARAVKKSPVTRLFDLNLMWDFYVLRPETAHFNVIVYSDRGVPNGYRHMDGYSINTLSFINSDGVLHYVKFHMKTEQGIKNLDPIEAEKINSDDSDPFIRDLYNSIVEKKFPAWKMYIQIMTEQQAQDSQVDPFDPTKVWFHEDYPLMPVGRLVLNRNPDNHFAETEQLAFSPGNLIPGIAISPDRLLQARLFAYPDAQNYRLGPNYNQLPVNRPFKCVNYLRDGQTTIDNQNGAPNYYPNSYNGPQASQRAKSLMPKFQVSGTTGYYSSLGDDENNFTQARVFYQNVLDEGGKARLVVNITTEMNIIQRDRQIAVVEMFRKVDEDLGRRLGVAIGYNP